MPATLHIRRSTAIGIGIALLLAGASGAYLLTNRANTRDATPARVSETVTNQPAPRAVEPAASNEVVIQLTADAVSRAGLEVATVTASRVEARVTLVGTVQPNSYKTVSVTPLAAGRLTRVSVELGERVRVGQTIAEMYSPEVAEAQTRYVTSRAELEAHELELRRTEKLVEIGSASRQALERLHAEHTSALTAVEANLARLRLLGWTPAAANGLTASSINGQLVITAPTAGVVTARAANVGLNVDAAMPLATIVDLSTVWVVGDLYERDFGLVRVGAAVTLTLTAYPGETLTGEVAYIDPQVRAETRTAQVRVEIPNSDGKIRLGMFADLSIASGSASTVTTIPVTAVQQVGGRSVVYVVDPAVPGKFTERVVEVGGADADFVRIISGVQIGEQVVSKGSFSLRAERDRLGMRAEATAATTLSMSADWQARSKPA